MPASQVLSTLTSLSNEDQFSANRYAVLFKPGAYNVEAPVGYYESIAGLGESPNGVTITGFLTPNFGTTFPGANVTTIFWRSMENMSFDPAQNTAQSAAPNTLQWGVSQAAPLRRVQINGSLELTDSFCGNASGGFISDSVVTGSVNPCSQQQWYTRDSSLGSWTGGVWNMVFSGVEGAPAQSFPAPPETVLPTTPVSREKPFLYMDAKGNYDVFAPGVKRNSSGTTWAGGKSAGRSIPISQFFIAKPSMSAAEINLALLLGKNLILTPGIYKLNQPLNILYPDTVVVGLGYATLVPQTGKEAISVADVNGVQIAGLIIDAGPVNSPVLFRMGAGLPGLPLRVGGFFSHASDPSGLFVEHYQKEQVLWNGTGGQTIFYQSELPYDPPSQSAWMDGTANGYPSYVVADRVSSHTAYGLGIYSFFELGINIVDDNAMTVPDRNGIAIHDAGTVWLNGSGQITHVINGEGAAVNSGFADQLSPVVNFP
jgi:hypothetical protein